jgi:CDGSH-type Zn-finger protein
MGRRLFRERRIQSPSMGGAMKPNQYVPDREMLLVFYDGFVRCPNTGRIIEVLKNDNKVLCRCGKSNPRFPQEDAERTGCHFVAKLRRATVDEFIEQEIKDELPPSPLSKKGIIKGKGQGKKEGGKKWLES